MGLENAAIVDAMGSETSTGFVVLTIVDSWDWNDERAYLLALQAKLNSYLDFIEEGQMVESFPDAAGRKIVIELVARYEFPAIGLAFLEKARDFVAELQIEIRFRVFPEPGSS